MTGVNAKVVQVPEGGRTSKRIDVGGVVIYCCKSLMSICACECVCYMCV